MAASRPFLRVSLKGAMTTLISTYMNFEPLDIKRDQKTTPPPPIVQLRHLWIDQHSSTLHSLLFCRIGKTKIIKEYAQEENYILTLYSSFNRIENIGLLFHDLKLKSLT